MAVKEESGMITVQIQIEEAGRGCQRRLSFVTERSLPLRRVFLDFCDSLDLVYGTVRFLLDGKRLNEEKTAEDYEINDGELIDAFSELLGAGPTTSTSTL